MARRELNERQWAQIRARWEGAHAQGDEHFRWLPVEVQEAFGIEVDAATIEQRAQSEGWAKDEDNHSIPLTPDPEDPPKKPPRKRGKVERPFHVEKPEPNKAKVYPVALLPGQKPEGYAGRGRPSDYRPEYCRMMDEFFQGPRTKTYVSSDDRGSEKVILVPPEFPTQERFALLIGVTQQVLYDWAARFPEFEQALTRARMAQVALLKEGGLAGHFNPSIVTLGLINGSDWKKAPEQQVETGAISADELDAMYGEVMQKSIERAERLREQRRIAREEREARMNSPAPVVEPVPAGPAPEDA